jgi:hypothetical protein
MKNLQYRGEIDRAARAAVLGIMATSAMTLLMVAGIVPGAPAAFRVFPVDVVHRAFPGLGQLGLTFMTLLMHFGYGAAAAAGFSYVARPMSVGRGLAYGLALWIVMQVAVVPWTYHWLEFGLGRGYPWTALDTLVLHLVYGGTLGWLGARDEVAHHSRFDEADRLVVA